MKELPPPFPKPKKERFKVNSSGYRFDKWLFRWLCLGIILSATLMVAVYGLDDNLYYHCPADTQGYCQNPFFDEVGNCIATDTFLCEQNAFPPNYTYGNKPSWVFANFGMIFLTFTIIAFLINHFKNNPRFAR